MELEAENVKNIRSLALCKEFLRQAIEQNDKLIVMTVESKHKLYHHKYKRCRAMMMWCASRSVMLNHCGNEKKSDWFWKWKDKWKKLAEQFKETK